MDPRLLALGLSLLGASPAPAKGAPEAGIACGEGCLTFSSARAAFEVVLNRKPLILGVGEYHETEGAPKVQSAIKRFTRQLLPALKGRASALVVETWMLSGRCGAPEKAAVAEVQKVTHRPESTEDEVTTLLGAAHDLGVAPHFLQISCEEYKAMVDASGELDAEKTLAMVGRKVKEKAVDLRDADAEAHREQAVVLYGGALHNDLYPDEDMKDFCFGPELALRTEHRYVELDLYVPEYIQGDAELKKAPWFESAMKLSRAGKTVLLNPRPDSYVLLFPRSR